MEELDEIPEACSQEEEEEVDLVSMVLAGSQVVSSVVSETLVLPLQTSLQLSGVPPYSVVVDPVNSHDGSEVEVQPMLVLVSVSVEEPGRCEMSL